MKRATSFHFKASPFFLCPFDSIKAESTALSGGTSSGDSEGGPGDEMVRDDAR